MTQFATQEYTLDHIGIAVNNLEEGSKFYKALGFHSHHVEVVESEKVRVAMFELANHSRIELLEPTMPDSPVGKFLEKRGPGIHHICLRVQDIRGTLQRLKQAGVQLINEQPKMGAGGCMVAFVHPKSAGGVLVELSERSERGDD